MYYFSPLGQTSLVEHLKSHSSMRFETISVDWDTLADQLVPSNIPSPVPLMLPGLQQKLTVIEFSAKVSGSVELLPFCPSGSATMNLEIGIAGDRIGFRIVLMPGQTKDSVLHLVDGKRSEIDRYVETINKDIEDHNKVISI